MQGSAPPFNNVGNPLLSNPGAVPPGANLGGHLDPGVGADYLLGQDQARLMASVSNSPGKLLPLPRVLAAHGVNSLLYVPDTCRGYRARCPGERRYQGLLQIRDILNILKIHIA